MDSELMKRSYCRECGEKGHWRRHCPKLHGTSSSASSSEAKGKGKRDTHRWGPQGQSKTGTANRVFTVAVEDGGDQEQEDEQQAQAEALEKDQRREVEDFALRSLAPSSKEAAKWRE